MSNKNEVEKAHQSAFEAVRKVNQQGQDYWSARELSKILGYSEFRHFIPVINKAKEACENSGQKTGNHFEDILEMVPIGSGAQREIQDVRLSRYACYDVGRKVRKTIEEIGGTMPENLPAVESIKLIERKQHKKLK